MDIVSHGLWGSLAFGRSTWKNFWLAFFFGIAPDLFSFGLFTLSVWLGWASGVNWEGGPPDPHLIPSYVHALYNGTHSLVVFASIFLLVWLLLKKPLYVMLAWPLHILVDIPTHTERFFPTPFLWPFSDITVSGIPWSDPRIFIPNVLLLFSLYVWIFLVPPKGKFRKKACIKEKTVL